ncbi:MAG: hypothetical protein NC394_00505 [Bacteroides sp.]|nr:hypothetical protein [Bacteroides sp.]
MDQNNLRNDNDNVTEQRYTSNKEYSLPQNKEQFKQVLEQAQQGQYRQEPQYRQYSEPSRRNDHSQAQREEQTEPLEYDIPAPVQTSGFSEYKKPVYVSRSKPSKKRFKPLAIIIPVVILLIAAAAVLFLLYGRISYRKAEENYFGSIITSAQRRLDSSNDESLPVQADIGVSTRLGDAIGVDLSSASLHIDTATQGGVVYNTLDAALGKVSVNAESWTDKEKGGFILLLPRASDIYAYLDASDMLSEISDTSEYIQIYGDVLSKASETYFEIVGEPEAEKNAEFTVNETACTADKYSIHLDGAQIARIKKALIDSALENEKAAALLCKQMGCESKGEMLSGGSVKDELDRLNAIIDGAQTDPTVFDMTVYVKNRTVVNREAVVTFSDVSDSAEAETIRFDICEIPTDKGQLARIYLKDRDGTESAISCTDETDKELHSGRLTVMYGGDTYTADYSELAVTRDLFVGKISVTSVNNPAFIAAMELKTEDNIKSLVISVPNIVTAEMTFKPSEMPFKEQPALSDGEYADFSELLGAGSGTLSEASVSARERFSEDMQKYILSLLKGEDIGSGTENNSTSAPSDAEKQPEETSSESAENNIENNTESASEDPGSAPDNTDNADNNEEASTQNSEEIGSVPETAVPESSAPSVPPSNTAPSVTQQTVPAAPAPTLDTGGSQKISNSQLDSFNSGNYYKTEIYIDGAANADSSVYISEISGAFDSYIKGKALQIDFAENYSFDSALVVITIPSSTVTSGRYYPDSEVLRGLNRYRLMGMNTSDSYESEISFYKYSGNQIGFIVEGPSYYYLIDMDEYYHSVLGTAPDDIEVQYD